MTEPSWLKEAAKQIGFHEGPNNENPFGDHYNIPNQPWCALFVSWCCHKVGRPLPSMQPGMPDGYAGVWYGMQWAKANDFWRHSWNAEPGDAIVYGWAGPGSPSTDMHTGLIVSSGAKGATGHTIEGNRSDQVERQTFTVGSSVVLGTIALTKILAKGKVVITPKPDPQPRHPKHPSNSGPGDTTPGSSKSEATTLGTGATIDLVELTDKLENRNHPVAASGGERQQLRAAKAAIERVLALEPAAAGSSAKPRTRAKSKAN